MVPQQQVTFPPTSARTQPRASFGFLGSLHISCGIGKASCLVSSFWSLGFGGSEALPSSEGLVPPCEARGDTKNTTQLSQAGNTPSRSLRDTVTLQYPASG